MYISTCKSSHFAFHEVVEEEIVRKNCIPSHDWHCSHSTDAVPQVHCHNIHSTENIPNSTGVIHYISTILLAYKQ